jgi:DNA-binding CsgD family transcriptional regulator
MISDDIFSAPIHFGDNFELLTTSIQALGFDDVLYSFYPKPMYLNKDVQPVLHFSSGFESFVEHYIKHDFGNRDFVLRLALQGRTEPVDWWQEIESGSVSPEEQFVTETARNDFHIHHGLSIPVLFGTFAIAGISVTSRKPDRKYFDFLKEKCTKKLFELGDEYHRGIIKSRAELHFFILPLLESLSDTKKKVLKHLMSGQPMKAIEHHYGITPRYAEKVLRNIRKEFGNISTHELLYIMGMINMHEYL